MKRTIYVIPEVNVIPFQRNDIITASTDPFDGEWVPIGESDQ